MITSGLITIVGKARAAKIKRRFDAVLTIQDLRQRHPLRFHKRPEPPHLRLAFEDYEGKRGYIPGPALNQARAILAFGRANAGGSLLIHCNAGASRSPAAALGILADRLDDTAAAWQELHRIKPDDCFPNRVLISHFDELLGTGGRLRAYADHLFDLNPLWQQRSAEMAEIVEKEFPRARTS